jgi:hypothetical protein
MSRRDLRVSAVSSSIFGTIWCNYESNIKKNNLNLTNKNENKNNLEKILTTLYLNK